MYKKYFKRLFDFTLAILVFILLFPLFLILYISILITMGRPVFFKQRRPGLNSQVFEIIKFRSMKDSIDKNGDFLADELRITKLGKFMRRNSLDEIPQLINVIKGNMSLVGPRPLAVKYLPYYSEKEMTRHSVRPGITGLAQINGRNAIDWDTKLNYDASYVERLSIWLDLFILYRTFLKIIKRNDVSSSGIDAPGDFDIYRRNQKKTKV